jgi:hypothetical protein
MMFFFNFFFKKNYKDLPDCKCKPSFFENAGKCTACGIPSCKSCSGALECL